MISENNQKEPTMSDKYIDLRSDTVTKPTQKMREAIYRADVGDDVLSEDPTVNRLEKLAAKKLGKEAALLVPSGTFGNQLSLFTHCNQGNEVILCENSHIVQHEAGASSVISSVQLRTILPHADFLTWDEIERRIRKTADIHYPKTGVISLENPLSLGIVPSLQEMERIYKNAHEKYDIPIHLDGARIFNAAAFLETPASEIAKFADSVMICLSKGLCAPIGSLLVGSKKFIQKARRNRKIMGGGMRQAGFIAAAGVIALEEMTARVKEDNQRAQKLAKAFKEYDLFDIDLSNVMINMFFVNFNKKYRNQNPAKFVELLKEQGILTYPPEEDTLRFVTHRWITKADIDYIINQLPEIVNKFKKLS